jgi:hypothetical protein
MFAKMLVAQKANSALQARHVMFLQFVPFVWMSKVKLLARCRTGVQTELSHGSSSEVLLAVARGVLKAAVEHVYVS